MITQNVILFSFSKTSYLHKAKELSLLYYNSEQIDEYYLVRIVTGLLA